MYDYKRDRIITEIATCEKLHFGVLLSSGVHFLAVGDAYLHVIHLPTKTITEVPLHHQRFSQILEAKRKILIISDNQILFLDIEDYSFTILMFVLYSDVTIMLQLKNNQVLISSNSQVMLFDENVEHDFEMKSALNDGFFFDGHTCMAEMKPNIVLAVRDKIIDRIDCNVGEITSIDAEARHIKSITPLTNGTYVVSYDNDDISVYNSDEQEIKTEKVTTTDQKGFGSLSTIDHKVFEMEPNVICFLNCGKLMRWDTTCDKGIREQDFDADSILCVQRIKLG
jgi:hypothetical protein